MSLAVDSEVEVRVSVLKCDRRPLQAQAQILLHSGEQTAKF
jgi:hypothetical protein